MDKHFARAAELITQEEYLKIPWLNVVPEIVCDILCYLTHYFHYRSDLISKEAYSSMLTGQILNMHVATQKSINNFEQGGWRYSTNGIAQHMKDLDNS